MKTKTTDQLMREIRQLKREKSILEKENDFFKRENRELKSNISLIRSMTQTTTKDLKEYINKYNKLVKDVESCYPSFTIN